MILGASLTTGTPQTSTNAMLAAGAEWWRWSSSPGWPFPLVRAGWMSAAGLARSARRSWCRRLRYRSLASIPSEGYITHARKRTEDEQVTFVVGDARALPFDEGAFDAVVSGLALNFVPDPALAVEEMGRVTRPGTVVAAYVWDYAGQMQLLRYFWDAATALDAAAHELDQGRRFPLCHPDTLATVFRAAGLIQVETRAIDTPTVFRDFDDYWTPFLGGQGPAPGYAMSLSEERMIALRERLRASLPSAPDGTVPLIARAWAVRGIAG